MLPITHQDVYTARDFLKYLQSPEEARVWPQTDGADITRGKKKTFRKSADKYKLSADNAKLLRRANGKFGDRIVPLTHTHQLRIMKGVDIMFFLIPAFTH
jgi:hypothetical protein